MTKKTMMVSIMPTVGRQRRPDLHYVADISPDLPEDAAGEAVGECLRRITGAGVDLVTDLVELNVRFG